MKKRFKFLFLMIAVLFASACAFLNEEEDSDYATVYFSVAEAGGGSQRMAMPSDDFLWDKVTSVVISATNTDTQESTQQQWTGWSNNSNRTMSIKKANGILIFCFM